MRLENNEKYLVINAGSSSLKFSLYEMPEVKEIVNGVFEKIGANDSFYTLKYNENKVEKKKLICNHTDAVITMLDELKINSFINDISEIKGVGHRVLHGGEYYSDSVVIDEEVMNNINSLIKFGPLHLPGEIAGIKSMQEIIPKATQVAVFDTAFHQSMPKENYIYAVPYDWYKNHGVRKYGFHGTSHKYITETMKEKLNKDNVNLIVCHIGSGASVCCVKNGKSFDTSMGLTPLDGTVMGTRSGAIDASIIEYICKEKNYSVEDVTSILNKNSGLKGISGVNDFRDLTDLVDIGDKNAKLALNIFENSVIDYIAKYYIKLNGNVDAIIFTAGIGENCINFREDIINKLSNALHININKEINNNIAKFKDKQTGIITTDDSKIPVYVIPTNEEYMILKDTYMLSQLKELNNSNTKKLIKK